MNARRAFLIFMVPLATLFGCAVAAWRLGGQGDLIFDLLKIGFILAVATTLLGFVIWSVLHGRGSGSIWRGAIAGALTGALIVPLPFFAWTLKTELLSVGGLMAVPGAFKTAIHAGLWTFEEMTKASLAAIMGSAGLGAIISSQFSSSD